MNWKLTYTLLISLLFIFPSIAQPPVDCGIPSPPGADACPSACVYCDLTANGYVGSTIGYTPDAPNNFCGTIENNQWFAFAAGTTTVEFTIISSNCTFGDGVQGAIYTGCPQSGPPVACDGGQNNGEGVPIIVTANNLVVGDIYWFMVDGWAGDQCDYDVSVTQGNTDPPPLGPPGPITGPLTGCAGDVVTYTIPDLTGASYYEWTLPDGTTVNGTDPFVDYTFGPAGQVCVTASNVCNFSTQVCIDLMVVLPDAGTITANPIILCPNELTTISISGGNTDPEFSTAILIIDDGGFIIDVISNSSSTTFTFNQCRSFQACAYNYITAQGPLPQIGENISTIDCTGSCCDLTCTNFSFEDTETPTFPGAPADETLTCYDLLTPLAAITWADNCDGTGTVTGQETGGADLCSGGTIVRTWEYTDFCLNAATHVQTITINPTPPPVFDNLPPDMTVDCDNIPSSGADLTYTNNGTGGCLISGTVTPSQSGSGDICGGTLTYDWDFTDACGNTITHTQNITITPALAPSFINPPANATLSCDNIPTSAPDLDYSNFDMGACLIAGTVPATQNGSADVCGGDINYSWEYTDVCNNTITHTQTVTITPALPAAFINPPASTTVDCNNIPTSPPDLAYTNNGSGACLFDGMVPATQTGSADICGGTINYTWDYTDPCNNNINYTQSITVTPAPLPVFTNIPIDETITCGDPIPAFIDLTYDNSATGTCAISGSVVGTESNNYDACGGSITRTWTFTDPCSNTINHTQTITVNPGPPPVFTNLPTDISYTCGDVIPPLADLNYDNGSSGLCAISGTAPGVETGSYDACGGSLSRTWTYSDACNNISHTQTITINPAPPPSYVNSPPNATISCDIIPPIPPLNYDNGIFGICNISGQVAGSQSGSYNACGGSLTRVWNTTDLCGNPLNYTQTLTVDPAPPPAFVNPPPNVSVTCDNIPNDQLTYDNGATGLCNISGNLTPSETGSYNACGGSLTRNWDFTDPCGNTITHTQVITVIPSPPPMFINPPSDINVPCTGIPPLQGLPYTNNTQGICAINGNVPGTESGQTDACGGTLIRLWTFTDICGNTITHTQNITVSPAPPPTFSSPPTNTTLTCGDPLPPLNNLFYSNGQPGNCSISGSSPGSETGSYDACGGLLTRTWTATTICGAVINHTQTITIDPAPAPVFLSPPADVTVTCGDIPTFQDLFYTNGLSGLCEISGTFPGTETGSYNSCGGSLLRTWNFTDLCGSLITHNQTITVEPAPPPQFVNLPGSLNLNCGEVPPPLNDLFYDNGLIGLCAIDGTVPGVETGSLDACGGTLIRTWDFADACGNTLSHTQVITSLPAPIPIFELPPQGTVISCDEDYPMVPLSYYNGASGICDFSGSVMGVDESDGLPCQEEIIRTWTYTDPCGNTIVETELIISLDFTPPIMDPPPPDQVLPCSGDIPPMTELGWWDNCEGTGTVLGVDVSDGGNPETITRTWVYADACGNEDIAVQIFTVNNFEILQALAGLCDNQGTLSDPSDDTYDVTVEATIGLPGPSNQYTVTDGSTTWGPFDYGSPAMITGLPADGSSITLTFADVDDPDCSAIATVSQVACSTDCQLVIEPFTQSTCDDNGTPSDPTDDFFDVTVNATATNGGPNNQFTVSDGTTTWGPFDYGTGGLIPGLPANGATITLTFSDVDIPGCANQLQLSSASCSGLCQLTITNSTAGPCQDQGTPSDPADDTFDLTVNATAENPGASGQFTVTDGTTTWGPFDYGTGGVITGLPANGTNITLTFNDADDPTCSATVAVSQVSCSDLCVLSVDQANVEPCDNNGTDADPSDDTFEVTVNASALNPGASGQFTVTDGTTTWGPFDYGVGGIVGPLPANGNTLTLTFSDVDITACAQQVQVSSNPCSSSCILAIDQLSSAACNDNGTPSDPSDDTFDVTVNASATNPGASGQFTVTDGTTTWGPFDYGVGGLLPGLPADGSTINLVFTDADDISCNATASVTSASCSDLCVFSIDAAVAGPCSDNGTDADPSDDTYDVTVNASATNPGASNQFTVTDGVTTWGPFDYGVGGTIPDLPANGNNITLIFTDADNNTCTQQVQVSSNPCSSSCILAIDQVLSAPCDDNGTPSDPADDTFEVTINASATNPGASGQFTVTDGTNTWGPFDYGVGGIIPDLPADGSTINLTFTDVDDISCNASATVSSPSCSDLCLLTIDEANIGPCDNNGTDTDPDDDTFEVTVNASALNPGVDNQFTVTDGTTTWGPFDYGTGGTIPNLPANGMNITLTFSDANDPGCFATVDVTQLPCSSACILAIDQVASAACDDNGTPSDPSDDIFEVTVNASATNPGPSGQFTVTDGTTTWGPFDYGFGGTIPDLPADGNDINLIFSDVDDISCNNSATVNSESCSDLCVLTIDEATAGACDNNGTDTDSNDDFFEVTVNATAINPGVDNQFTVTDGTTTWGPFDYGTGGTIPGLSANGINITLTFEDANNTSCSESVDVVQLPCSSACIFSIDQVASAACDDNGTPSDPTDDTFDVTVNASATNPGPSGQFTVTDGTTTWGPFDYGTGGTIPILSADGSTINLIFSDIDDISCNASETVSSPSCSDLCVLAIDEATTGACDNNGTDTDATDDIFEVTVNATAINPGADNQFTVTDGTTTWGPFDYGTGGTIPGLSANGFNITLTFEDANNTSCSESVDVVQLPCSSACIFSIDQVTSAACDDNGTPSDPTDDTFDVTVNASATNPGPSGQFTVTDGTTTWGPFDYGTGGTIPVLSADGSTINLIFSDVDDISCNASETVSSPSCSDLCVLTIDEATAGACDDNGSDSDPSDDIFGVTVNATAINPGVDNQFTVTDGTTIWGPFDYGVGGTIPGFSANGINTTLTFSDTEDAGCTETVNVVQFPCSSACVFSIDQVVSAACDNNGTPSDPSDDTFDVTVNASAINPGASGQFTVTDGTNTWGPFDYGTGGTIPDLPADGSNINLIFSDADDISCNDSATVSSGSCSDLCVLTIDEATAGACDDNGSDSDPSDDIFEVTVNATALNPGVDNQFTVTDGTTIWGPFDYGTGGTIPGFSANGINITLTFSDTEDAGCSETVNVVQFPCSSACVFSIDQVTSAACDDNGTPSDPSDDTFDVIVNASAINPGASGQFTVTDGTNTWGPFDYGTGGTIPDLPADGSNINLIFSDADDISCNDSATVSSGSCSDLCVLTIDEATAGACDDNGSDSDPSDDIFEVTVNATALNPGVDNQFTVTDGTTTWGPFDYGVGGTIPGFSANGINITLTFSDTEDAGCSETVNVVQFPCSSACVFSIDQVTSALCDDNGTPSDPIDDTFEVTVNASAINPGPSGQFTVTDGTNTWGPFGYGIGGTIPDLPADGSDINLIFSDLDDISCNDLAIVSSGSCSDLCVFNIEEASAGPCNDNGTNADPIDDFFDVTVNATAINPGASNQFTVTDGTTTWGPFVYGIGGTIPGLSANGINMTFTFSDADDSTCSDMADIIQFPCSSTCVFSIDQVVSAACDDNGTPSDPIDDTFEVTVNASAINPGPSGQFTVTDGTNTWGPFGYGIGGTIPGLPADGSDINLIFSDLDDISCNDLAIVSSGSCSDLCVFAIEAALAGPCDNLGSLANPDDDLFDVTVNASAINPGLNNQFTVTDGTTTWGPFDYGVGGIITGLSANGNNITLTFTDADDLICTSSINVSQEPCSVCDLTIDAGPNQLINCANPFVQLLATSSEPAFFEWAGPGINATNQNQEQPMVDQAGLYTLTVSNLNTGCVEMDEVLVDYIDDAPIAVASGGEITCATTSITLSSTGSSTGNSIVYTWSGPDPNLDINSPNPEISVAGVYVLIATDTANNCVSQPDTVQIGTNTEPPVAIINLIGSLTCISIGALIDGQGSSVGDSIQYSWLFDEAIIPGANSIVYQATQQGTYTFVVLNILNGCDASDSLYVEDDMTYPIASAGEPALLNCYLDSVQLDGSGSTNLVQIAYEWTGPVGGILSGGNTTNPWVGLPGQYILSVVDTLNGCENLDTVFVSQDIVSPVADAGEDVTLDCISLDAGLDGTGSSNGNPYSFEWFENTGNIASGEQTLEPMVDAPGDYILLITNTENGCTSTDNVLVIIPDSPTDVFYTALDPICFGDDNGSIVIDSVAGGQPPYTYGLDEQLLTSNESFFFLSSGTYILNIQDSEGCTYQTSISLQEGNDLYIQVSDDETINLGDSVGLNAFVNIPPSFVDSLQWDPVYDETYGMTLNCGDCYDPIAKPFRTTSYTATVWDLDGCIARDDVTINLIIDRNIYIPNAFSPNGDGINDKFTIYSGIDVLQINRLQIYDRWGEEVFVNSNFAPNDPDHGWDGTLRGEPMNPAVFVYWAEIEFIDGYVGFYKGDITIVK